LAIITNAVDAGQTVCFIALFERGAGDIRASAIATLAGGLAVAICRAERTDLLLADQSAFATFGIIFTGDGDTDASLALQDLTTIAISSTRPTSKVFAYGSR
jgi:hypothetical protein